MSQVKQGDKVKVNYTGRLEDGSVFDTTESREALQFVLGEDRLIPGFEQAVLGMSPGESKTVTLPPEDAYGPRREEMVATIDRASFPKDIEPRVGQKLQLEQRQGAPPIVATVTQVGDSTVTVDANHPLAGRALTFEISVLEIA